jgi:hypothetical protein
MRRVAIASLLISGALWSGRPSAQEVQITGPLASHSESPPPSYLPWWLRGDGVLVADLSRDRARFEGPGGTLRYRGKGSFAWETGFAYLRGIDDAKARSIPSFGRATFIDSRGSRPDWDFYLALGPTFEWSTSKSRLGGEIAVAVDRRIDPIWNRFIVELALDARRSLQGHDRWTPAVMLRVGIATTFGFRKDQ